MEYNNTNTLICIDNTKDACLYFNEVIPLNIAHITPWENNGDLETHEVLHKILPTSLLDSSNPIGLKASVISYIEAYVNVMPSIIGVDEPFDKERAAHFFPLLMKRKDEIINSLHFPVNSVFGTENTPLNNNTTNEDPAFILSGLKLVDTSQIKWRQIIELREDKESINKLRRLRTFIFQNYKDKPLTFIQDDLLNRIETYETTTKHLGLKTSDSSLKIIFNSGTLVANTAATIASVLSGTPVTIPLTLGIGSAFMLGNVGLELRSYKRELYKFKQEDPITYLVDIKEIA